jgi:hypothetical protein
VIGGLRLARRMFAAPALKPFVLEESQPGGHAIRSSRTNVIQCEHC